MNGKDGEERRGEGKGLLGGDKSRRAIENWKVGESAASRRRVGGDGRGRGDSEATPTTKKHRKTKIVSAFYLRGGLCVPVWLCLCERARPPLPEHTRSHVHSHTEAHTWRQRRPSARLQRRRRANFANGRSSSSFSLGRRRVI
jgi:hypothetical protein